ncbi:MAG: hypothetical protein E7584_01995 [Ruminococcaceae bacterium]|nr:hypothetical protein [Oscillospiraceae bacterium]
MGFGYLLLGYLVTYVISITASSVGFGSLAILAGSALMFWGIRNLCRFNISFVSAKWLTLPIFALGLCRLWQDVAKAWLSWEGTAADVLLGVVTWASFATTLLFHFALLYAIRVLALEVGLNKLSSHAMYNTLAVGIWGALFLLCNMPTVGEKVLPYFSISMALFNLVYLISNAVLLLRCAKNICAEGDEEVAPKPSRFEWINRISASYNQTMDKLKENSRADGDAFWHKHMEKKPQNTANQKNKKKKKK